MDTTANALGATLEEAGVRFAVRSETAQHIWVCLFDVPGDLETDRIELSKNPDGLFTTFVAGLEEGARYGLRADGPYDPSNGLWFDPDKLLVDPYATDIDRRYVQVPQLAARRGKGGDTAPFVPKAVVRSDQPVADRARLFQPGGLIYEVPVRAFTMLHPAIPEALRGTVGALAHPAIIEHLKKIGVGAVELMPITGTIDERHLPPLGLTNAWGYNPVTFMPLDPRLAPGGIAELRATVETLRSAGIGVILDLVFNHTGESDTLGPTLSFRGLDNATYYRHRDGRLVNDTGCGNTIDCARPVVAEMVLVSLRHFVINAGVDGFRFDLAPILGRNSDGFDPNAKLLNAIVNDPVLCDRVLIAEPWDIGASGYQLGNFPQPFLEWNDRYRDDVRRFWRGDRGTIGALATRLAGSSDVFAAGKATRTVNFVAAHDGFALADVAAYERKHNEANGEQNRDGHSENLSWNNGVEGPNDSQKIAIDRRRDVIAMLSTLFASRGTIMLTAGDEFGRSQQGNNNAYAQDNALTWLDWKGRDRALEAHVAALATLRREHPVLADLRFLTGEEDGSGFADVEWLSETGSPLSPSDWEDQERRRLTMILANGDTRLAVLINGDRRTVVFSLPQYAGACWEPIAADNAIQRVLDDGSGLQVAGRSIVFLRAVAVA